MTTLYIVELAKKRGELDLLYKFTKIVAENDSIGEGWGYCSEYTDAMFNNDIAHIRNSGNCETGYLSSAGTDIYMTHLHTINAIEDSGWDIKYVLGDLVRDAERDFDVIGHGCNCYCTMGAGIALAVKNKWPEAYAADKASTFADSGKLGTYTKWGNDDITVLNMYTQWDYKGKSINADYVAIRNAMRAMRNEFAGKKIGLPLIGAGLAGGKWEIIEAIIKDELYGEDVTVVIWEGTREQWQLDLVNK